MPQRVRSFSFHSLQLNYLLYQPDTVGEAKLPLILFLHDADGRGSDLDLIRMDGLPKRLEEAPEIPFVVASPQLPPGMWWATMDLEWLDKLVEQLLLTLPLDPMRIYLTGIGMGAYGAWALAMVYPDRFAALVPIAGGGDPRRVCLLKHIPIWVIHGAKDNVVLPREALKMVDALHACDGNPKFTLFQGAGHDAWTPSYKGPALYNWLLKQQKQEA